MYHLMMGTHTVTFLPYVKLLKKIVDVNKKGFSLNFMIVNLPFIFGVICYIFTTVFFILTRKMCSFNKLNKNFPSFSHMMFCYS